MKARGRCWTSQATLRGGPGARALSGNPEEAVAGFTEHGKASLRGAASPEPCLTGVPSVAPRTAQALI